jgi:hypothetical protein
MRYPDAVKLATTTSDGYGDKTLVTLDEIPATFARRKGYAHTNNSEGETSDATVYLLPSNPTVLSKMNDLQGMYIQLAPYLDGNWYRITSVDIAERKLLNNAIDNVYCR